MQPVEKMSAIGFHRYGPPEVLEKLEVAKPKPAPDEIIVRVAAAGVNPADSILRSGQLRFVARSKLPFVPGADVAGVVAGVGEAVTHFRPGDEVYAMLPNTAGGGYAEYAAVSEDSAARVPSGLSLAEAAAVPLTALTALQALRDRANLQPGARVLINGASGGVGTFAVQISRTMGARVTAACSGRNADLVRGLGADEVLDYTRGDITAGDARYDVVFDAVDAQPFGKWRRALRTGGTVVTVNPIKGRLSPRFLERFRAGKRYESVLVRPGAKDLETITAWISAGNVLPVLDKFYPLADAAEAHHYIETKRARGKLVLIVDEHLATANAALENRRQAEPAQ